MNVESSRLCRSLLLMVLLSAAVEGCTNPSGEPAPDAGNSPSTSSGGAAQSASSASTAGSLATSTVVVSSSAAPASSGAQGSSFVSSSVGTVSSSVGTVSSSVGTVSSSVGTVSSSSPPSSNGGSGNDGYVGRNSEFDLAAHPIFSINMAEQDYAVHYNGVGVGTGTSTHHATGWWDNGAYSRITPPTTDGLERGLAVTNIDRGATLPIQDLNLRFEWRGGPQLASFTSGGPKFLIMHTRRTLTQGNADDRPMMFLAHAQTSDNPQFNRPDTLVLAPAQGTTQGWGDAVYADSSPPLYFYPNGAQAFYLGNAGDSGTFQERPLVDVTEVLTMEFRVVTVATQEHPNGLIAYRVYRRNGAVYERGIPWNWDSAVPLGSYITEVQQFGCGQWNLAPTPGDGVYMDVGGYITVARDVHGWLGPRAGFVTVP